MGIAAVEAAGLQEALGTMTKSFHPGKAAADGVEAALLAGRGFTGPEAPIEGRRGFAETAAPVTDYDAMLDGLGATWEVERNAFKPYACGIVSHPVIDAAIALRNSAPADDIEDVELTINPVVLDVMGVPDPQDGLQSKFSVYHCFATGFLDGAGGPDQYSDARARAPEVVALRARVHAITDPELAKDEARARIRTAGGEVFERHVEHATGSEAAPMTDQQLRVKAQLVASPVLGTEQTDKLVDLVFAIDKLDTIDALVQATRSGKAAVHA
jgi:2-methylcitrate dehydratase PrpD